MNENIQKLMKQAFTGCQGEQFDPEKFAQLMVFECVNAVMDGTKEGDHYAQRIEQHFDTGPGGILHFGVEE